MSEIVAPARNAIPERQNTEPLIKLLRARSQIYRVAVGFQIAQLVATVLLPIVGALASLWLPDWRATFAAAGVAFAGLDAFWLDREMKRKLKEAAKISEQFDTELLDIPWNSFVAGKRVDAQIVGAAAADWPKGNAKLINWYSIVVSQVELEYARLICQRSNLSYDGNLRRIYSKVLLGFFIFICLIVGITVHLNSVFSKELLLSVVLPLAPFIVWSVREFFRQKDAASGIEQIRDAADSLFDKILANNVTKGELISSAREFQDAILLRRSQNPLIAPKMYDFLRKRLEIKMGIAAEEIVRRLRQSGLGVARGVGKVDGTAFSAISSSVNGN